MVQSSNQACYLEGEANSQQDVAQKAAAEKWDITAKI